MIPVLSSFYFGSVEHYRVLAQYPKVIIDTGEHYERQSYRSRTSIIGPNGKQDLTVQIARRSGEKMPMRTVGLSYVESWPQQHLHAIRSAYGKTPWFIHYIDAIEDVALRKYDRLVDLDLATMRLGMKWLGSTTEVVVAEEYVAVTDEGALVNGTMHHDLIDLRTSFHPKLPLPPQLTPTPPYTQVFADRHGYVARLSIIDLVCNCGPSARRALMQDLP